jgi:hypothetical protein
MIMNEVKASHDSTAEMRFVIVGGLCYAKRTSAIPEVNNVVINQDFYPVAPEQQINRGERVDHRTIKVVAPEIIIVVVDDVVIKQLRHGPIV